MKLLHSAPHRAEAAHEGNPGMGRHHSSLRSEMPDFRMSQSRAVTVGSFQSTASDYAPESMPLRRVKVRSDTSLGNLEQSRFEKPVGGLWKRSFDIAVAGSAIIVMAPLMLFVALLILITMGRPIVFIQQRVGFNKRTFGCFKFRSMVGNAQERLERHLAQNEEAARMWRETQKLKHDPRITWLGQILRKSSLDELPQLFNILLGDMSCIGPRPVITAELSRYGDHADDYAKAKPGLTGFWQVSGRSNTTYAFRINCDRYYVRRWSLALDVMIVLRTIPAVLRFKETS
jgi:exopolysaccharide production protein ExoY